MNLPLMAPPVVKWPAGRRNKIRSLTCPNCGSDVAKRLVLTITFTTSPGSRKKTTVLRCPDCTCPFYAAQIPPDYAEEAMLERGRVPFYLQQGAGLSLITRPLAQLRAPAGTVYAEVGCGFGFGLDYARHAKNWIGHGIDPGGIAALGQDMLGVSIDRRYLGEAEPALAGTCDVVMASETIEHVLSPIGFVRVLRSMLRSGGTLILTTPDGDDLRPETSPSVLIGLLSPGLHLIFQTRDSLHRTLDNAGFGHIVIEKDGHSLVAFASDRPIDLERDNLVLKSQYRAYLERRSTDFPPGQDLFLAFAGRVFQEAVNDTAFDQARRALTALEHGCVARFGKTLEVLGERTGDHQGASLEDLSQHMPLNLGGLLYADAILRLASGEPRASLGKRFLQAAAAADLLHTALAELALADGMSEEVGWTARAEAVICAAAAGDNDIAEQLTRLPPAPDAQNGALRQETVAKRALVELVNSGHYVRARELADAVGFDSQWWADANVTSPRSEAQRDALFCLAVLDSQSDDRLMLKRSRDRFSRIKQILKTSDGPASSEGLFLAASRGEETAWTTCAEAVLRAAAAGEDDIVEQLSDLPPAPDAENGSLRQESVAERALVELVNAGHYALAGELVDATRIDSRSWADPNVTAVRSDAQRDALFCLGVLDSQSNDREMIERSRDRFHRIKQMLETSDVPGSPEGLFAAASRGETAASERLEHHDTAAALADASSNPVNG